MVWSHFFENNSMGFETVAVLLSARFWDCPDKLEGEEGIKIYEKL